MGLGPEPAPRYTKAFPFCAVWSPAPALRYTKAFFFRAVWSSDPGSEVHKGCFLLCSLEPGSWFRDTQRLFPFVQSGAQIPAPRYTTIFLCFCGMQNLWGNDLFDNIPWCFWDFHKIFPKWFWGFLGNSPNLFGNLL